MKKIKDMENTFKGTDKEWTFERDKEYPELHNIWAEYKDGDIFEMGTLVARTCYAPASEPNAQLIIHALPMLRSLESFVRIWPDLKIQLDFNESGLSEDYEELFNDVKSLIKSATTIK